MKLYEYFEKAEGTGVLSTAGSDGKVNAAIFSKPNILDDNTIAFIARERLTYKNLKENTSASYLFRENGGGYKGVRLYLNFFSDSSDQKLMEGMKKRDLSLEEDKKLGRKHIIYFTVNKILPLIGTDETKLPF